MGNLAPNPIRPPETFKNPHSIRLRAPSGDYLHLSGQGTTKTIEWAWIGNNAQAKALMGRAIEKGQSWDFEEVSPDGRGDR
ncbi:hypothetical protein [Celeribacter sp.]|uniref:hypothetical protein n=1 Tax=Celeribacter sp. TaxID=1890673 RepID=UPI003A925A61